MERRGISEEEIARVLSAPEQKVEKYWKSES